MSPDPVALVSKEKVSIEFVGRYWAALWGLWWSTVSAFMAISNRLGIYATNYAKSGDWMISSRW